MAAQHVYRATRAQLVQDRAAADTPTPGMRRARKLTDHGASASSQSQQDGISEDAHGSADPTRVLLVGAGLLMLILGVYLGYIL